MRPHRFALTIGLLAAALTFAACEEEEGGNEDVASAVAAQGKVTRTPADADQPFLLAEGIYRVGWKTNGCPSLTVVMSGDNGYEREKTSTLPQFSFIATGVKDGNYTIQQTETGCAEWEVTVEKVGG